MNGPRHNLFTLVESDNPLAKSYGWCRLMRSKGGNVTEHDVGGDERLITIADVAGIYNVPVSTVRAWNREGKIPTGFMVGKHLRWKATDISADIARRASEAAAKVRQAVAR